jgi:methylenetetrahydrofolate reductase (NADPH)
MIQFSGKAERDAMEVAVRAAYMEVFPTTTIEQRLAVLEPGSYVAVTCSPSKGVAETLAMTARLAEVGFRVIPHLAAKMVRDHAHLKEILHQLDDLPVDSIFVPGGDAKRPIGEFETAFDLLRAISEHDHKFQEIGVAAHPEGHPDAGDERLMVELEKKQPLATYLVTQMCFDPGVLANWLVTIRERGIHLPAWLGIPGEADRAALLKTSMRIGVGDSLRFLKRKSDAATQLMKARRYTPDKLLSGIAPLLVDPVNKIDGFHIFCFNLVEQTEGWRHRTLQSMADAEP